jgi:competence protein ComEC
VNGLAAAGVALLLVEPSLLSDLGFRLSFAATAGILLLAPGLRRAWGSRGWAANALSISVAAQLATLPITVSAFSTVPLLAPVLNLLFVPWTGVCLLAGALWLVVRWLGAPIDPGWLEPLAWPFSLLARWPAPWWAVATWTPSWLAACVATGAAAWLAIRPRRWRTLTASAVALRLLLVSAPAPAAELWMIDVGQGDAFLLRSGRRSVLIDGGGWRRGDAGRRVLLPALSRLGVRRLDLVVLSHPDVDHCGGLADLAGRIPIAALWLGAGAGDSGCGRRLASASRSRMTELEGGERARVGAWSLEVGPVAADGSTNRRSVILRAEAGGSAVLFTGDVDAEGERELLRSGFELRADVLKVSHHGSRSSTTAPFLAAVSPRYALVSAGRGNVYGHPSGEVLDRLLRRGVTVVRTDLDGRAGLRFGVAGEVTFEVERIRSRAVTGWSELDAYRWPRREP